MISSLQRVALVVAALAVVLAACSESTQHAASRVASPSSTDPRTAATGGEPVVPPRPRPRPARAAIPAGPRARVVFSVHTHEPVVFVTIDDGFVRDRRVLLFLAAYRWPITTFIIGHVAQSAPSYFRRLLALGAAVEDHTWTHPDLPTLTYSAQQSQICQPTRVFPTLLGVHPRLFRAPYGDYDDATRRAATACGFDDLIDWTATMTNGTLTVVGHRRLYAGDIILLHFTHSLYSDLQRLRTMIAAAHLHVARLETYLAVS